MFRYLAVLAVMLACFTGDVSAVTDQEFQDLINVMQSQGAEIKNQAFEISELKDENKWLRSENRRQDDVIHQLQAVITHYGLYDPKAGLQADLVQNTTIEERVSFLEVQVAELDEDVTELEGDVNFLFDEQVIQDERLLNLETSTDALDEEVEDIEDEIQALDDRVTVLEENGGSDGNSSISELEERVETLEGTSADQETRITNLEGSSADHETRLTAAEENIQGLQTTDINHESRISALEENGGGGGSSNGTVAFYAVLISYTTIPDNSAVEFHNIRTNRGNGYNSSTGVFTVTPGGDGLYYFSTYLLASYGEWARFDITLNDARICTAYGEHDNLDVNRPQATCSAVVSGVEGDEVKVVRRGGTDDTPLETTQGWFYNGFNGFRI